MPILLLPAFFGLLLNCLNAGANSPETFKAALIDQFKNPAIEKADPTKYNQ